MFPFSYYSLKKPFLLKFTNRRKPVHTSWLRQRRFRIWSDIHWHTRTETAGHIGTRPRDALTYMVQVQVTMVTYACNRGRSLWTAPFSSVNGLSGLDMAEQDHSWGNQFVKEHVAKPTKPKTLIIIHFSYIEKPSRRINILLSYHLS